MGKKVIFEHIDKTVVITIDNPPVNALDEQVLAELEELIVFVSEGNGIRALIITGAGEKFFMAGADISDFPDLKEESGVAFVKRRTDLYDRIAALPFPVICALNGTALGGGLELALACDMRIMAKNAKVGLPETGLGIFPGIGGTQRLPRLVGSGMAKLMIFTGAPIKSDEAYQIGLYEQLSEAGAALADALKLAGSITANAPVALAKAKQVIDEGLDISITEAMALENRVFGLLCSTDDKNEGAAAFLEKRKSVFTGK